MRRTDTSTLLPISVVAFAAAASGLLWEVTAPLRDRETDISTLVWMLVFTILNGAFLRNDLRMAKQDKQERN